MKVKRGICDFDKIVIPHLQASFLYFSSFYYSVSWISLGSRFLFPLLFLCSSNLSSFSLYFIVFICFYRSRSRSFFYIIYLFYFIISFGSTFLSSQLNKYERKLHFFYLLTCLSLFPFFILLFFHPSNQTDLLH